MYCLIVTTPGGSISDKLWYETRKEAESDLEFYRRFYEGGGYRFQIREAGLVVKEAKQ